MNQMDKVLTVQSLLEASRDTLLIALRLINNCPDLVKAAETIDLYSGATVWMAGRLQPADNSVLTDNVRDQQARLAGVRMMLQRMDDHDALKK